MGSQQARGLAEADRLIHSCGHTHMLKNGKSKSESDSSLWVQPPTAPKLLHFCNTYGTAHLQSHTGEHTVRKPIVRAITHAETHRPGYSCILVIVPLIVRKPIVREHIFLCIFVTTHTCEDTVRKPLRAITHAETHCPG